MTEEQQDSLSRELEAAIESDDDARLTRAHSNILLALIDCQRKTADRVKELRIDRDREKHRREGAKWLWGILAAIASSGGGALILKALSSFHF